LSKELKEFERQVKLEAKSQYHGKPLEGNVRVEITAFFRDNRRPDLFNIPKSLCDALQDVIYLNDKQIIIGKIKIGENALKDNFIVIVEKF